MTKLWNKNYSLNQVVEQFMTGDDPKLDLRLVKYDCQASIAQAAMLHKIGILSNAEFLQLKNCLLEVLELDKENKFIVADADEDIHTALENYLVTKLGDVGKKIHTARSRNDQVLVALRLFMQDHLIMQSQSLATMLTTLINFAKTNEFIPYVGRTHMQKAMPSSMGLWMGAYIESLLDDSELLKNAYTILDQSPLGSAASFGVMLDIDREFTASQLGFSKVQNNVLYANNSRGKFESIFVHALVQIMNDLSKLATDVILFSTPEFGYLKLPDKFCPGSSLMPNKKNPDPFELIRAKSATVTAQLFQILEITRALPSGYNRDFQETKRPLFEANDTVFSTLETVNILFADIQVDQTKCLAGFSPEVFATDKVMKLVTQGMTFRDAYKQVGLNLDSVAAEDPVANILAKKHVGATGNLNLEQSQTRITELINWCKAKEKHTASIFNQI